MKQRRTPFDTSDPTQFLTYFVMSALAAGLRVSMSTYRGTLSINFLFVLIGLVHLTDFVARMGGDEFVIVMPGAEAGNFHIRAAQLSQLAADAGRMITGQNILSCAVGAARFPEDGPDSEQLLSVADQRMYRNKYETREQAGNAVPGEDRDGWPQARIPASTLAKT